MRINRDSWEEGFSIYEDLLAKFSREAKVNSYKNLKIEYMQLKYSYLKYGYIYNFLDKYWWNYGFSKTRVVGWTTLFLLFFLIGNLLGRNSINKYFVLFPEKLQNFYSYKRRIYYSWNIFFRILLFTFVIFFTFKLDIEKLSKHNTRFIAWIFLQYVIGLICLFFLFNAVLKL